MNDQTKHATDNHQTRAVTRLAKCLPYLRPRDQDTAKSLENALDWAIECDDEVARLTIEDIIMHFLETHGALRFAPSLKPSYR